MALTARQITARIPHQSQKWVPKCPFLCQLLPGRSYGALRALSPRRGDKFSSQQTDKPQFTPNFRCSYWPCEAYTWGSSG